MKDLQLLRTWRLVTALVLTFAAVVPAVISSQVASATPIDTSAWEKISTTELENAFGSYGTTYSIVEHEDELYVGGIADPEDSGDYEAVVYTRQTNGNWELVSPNLGAGEDSRVTHMAVFQGKLYVAVDAWGNAPLKMWTYDITEGEWTEDDAFTLNDARVENYVIQVLGMEVVNDTTLCATTLDMDSSIGLAVMCTNGTDDWYQLPSTGLNIAEGTSNFYTNLFVMPGYNGIGIVVNYDAGDDEISSVVVGYNDVTDTNDTWLIPPGINLGPDRVVSAFELVVMGGEMGIFAAVGDYPGGANVEIKEIMTLGMTLGENEDLRASNFLGAHVDEVNPMFYAAGTDSQDMAVLRYYNGMTNSWENVGPSAEQVGPEGINPAEYVTALNVQDDGDIFLGLQGNDAASGKSTIWHYNNNPTTDDPTDEENAPNNGDANNDGIKDAEQDNVLSFASPVTGKYVTVEVDEDCEITTASVAAESANAVQDSGFEYSEGFVNFTADCGTPGYTTSVTIYYHGVASNGRVVRKHNPNSRAYFTITSASLGALNTPLSGTKVAYTITDNGELDIDDTDGVITDPVGLASSAIGAPNTGIGSVNPVPFILTQRNAMSTK